MKKFMAIAAVVVVSFSAQSSFCDQSGCKVTFVDVDVDGTEKPIMLLDAAELRRRVLWAGCLMM
jgi:hypothetical protein